MVQAIIKIDDETNRVLNIIKAKFGLKDKSEAIDKMAQQYEECILEPQLKPEYIEKAKNIMNNKKIHIGTTQNLKKRLNL
jgi:hypothetical protein